jgi:hypothetical protein
MCERFRVKHWYRIRSNLSGKDAERSETERVCGIDKEMRPLFDSGLMTFVVRCNPVWGDHTQEVEFSHISQGGQRLWWWHPADFMEVFPSGEEIRMIDARWRMAMMLREV